MVDMPINQSYHMLGKKKKIALNLKACIYKKYISDF